ncbi:MULTISPECIES: helix-turn-helix domain-containing protein [Streptomyces]|uniref:Helix-turn-helix domain-containing protein n=1 Tax=Streptomyces koelreuteriae TaxID=2838015 RepID=A0ABX8G329_9ACTN|nr:MULTISPECIES: helix-turn-helix domain-containing protein [Streptomyces]QWB27654.1 helix-turn-helix domain-containing protein [Streptomyces koelreuteriae]UUA10750.1 helix-turn-helix domain-containing protein [Streptomyces koelreuteriae]UUA18357.1 helix-turn-helix domain-containing protein [Streptomyces sp. CRCS-T-1]
MAGRHEVPVDPAAGPVQRFAFELRKLRAEADGITYRALARRAGYSVTTLSQAAGGERLPTLPVALAYAEACGGDPAEWEARWKEAVEESAGDGSRGDDGSLPPYRGLARFETGDSGLFFGREQLTDDLVELLRRRRFAAVFGPSGSGKSSLLRAGLIPVLRHAQEPDLRPAAIRILTPGERPARNHASLLIPATPPDGSAGADTFLMVDQFEEVFTLCHDPAERARFIDLLLRARQPESRLRVLLAVRGDFYGRCAEARDLADALRDANLLAGAMSRAELRAAVVKPAQAAGLTVERALTGRLVEEVADAPGGLPLLSHALLETWRRRRGKTLTLAGYEAAGCLDGAIARTAEEAYGRFTDEQATAARRVLLRLVAPGDGTPDTRRPVDRAELPGTAQVVDALAGARLLTLDGDTVEMAHEALITAWPRLRRWIEDDRERLRAHRDLTEAAHAWQELGREEGALYRGSRLAAAREHFGDAPREELTDLERAFLDASGGHERRGRRRYRLVLTAVTAALCLALVAAGLAVGQWQSAVSAQHVAQSRQLAAQSGALLDSEPDLASLLAVHAYRISPTREAAAALYAAAALPLSERLVSGTEPVGSIALSPDGRTVATHSRDGKVRIWDLPGGRLRQTFTGHDTDQVAAFSPDGRTLAVAMARESGTEIGMWDPVTGRKLGTLAIPDGAVGGLAFSADGRTVAATSPAAVRVWDVATGRTRHSFTSLPDPEAVSFGSDGRTVAAVGFNGLVRVWDVATGRTRITHDSHIEGRAVAISPDGRTYVFVRTDGSVQLREVDTGALRRTISDGLPMNLDGLAFTPDGRTLAIPDHGDTVHLWDTASGAARGTVTAGRHGRGLTTVALSADGRNLVTSGNSDPTIRVHRLTAYHPRTTLRGHEGAYIAGLALGPDGRTVAAVRQERPGRGSVQLWDARTGDREATLTLDTGPVRRGNRLLIATSRLKAAGFGPTGRALAVRATENGVIEVREVATGRLRQSRARGDTGEAVFSPDGTRLALIGHDGSVRIWHLSTGALRTVDPGHGEPVRTLAFTPDGRTLAVAHVRAGHEQVKLLDAANGRTQRIIKPSSRMVLSLAFSPNGHTLATASSAKGTVKTWNARTGQLQDSFSVSGEVAALAFSSDSRTLAASNERGVHLWDLSTSQIRSTLPTRSPAEAVTFSRDGHTLAISAGTSVELWNVDLPDPARAIRDICGAIDTTLTPLERSRYLPDQSAETGCPAGR